MIAAGKVLGSKASPRSPPPCRACTSCAGTGGHGQGGAGTALPGTHRSPHRHTACRCHRSAAGAGAQGQGWDEGTKTLRTLVRDPSRGTESNSSDNCATSQHYTMFTEHLRKLPFWNNNTPQDKAGLFAVLPAEAGRG